MNDHGTSFAPTNFVNVVCGFANIPQSTAANAIASDDPCYDFELRKYFLDTPIYSIYAPMCK